ncbi:MAG: hypothetical protein GXP28_08610 [Planctomycetes bacterium]|nr:hypothetical protein [Planctomycetota bacterium]
MATVDQPDARDEVIVEVRRIKEALAAECDFDVSLIAGKTRERTKGSIMSVFRA